MDPSGARGLKLVPSPEKKESSSSVIKDIDGHSVTDGSDSNQHSSSRLSGCGEGEVRGGDPWRWSPSQSCQGVGHLADHHATFSCLHSFNWSTDRKFG